MNQKPTYEELERKINLLQIENNDIRKSLKAIEASELFHRLTIENISDTVIITDENGLIVYACPNARIIFGLTQNQVYKKKTVQKLLNGNICDLSKLSSAKEFSNIEWSIFDTSGQEKFVLITIKSVSINNGKALYVIRDISDRKHTEFELRESEERLNLLTQNSQTGIYIHVGGLIKFVNHRFAEMLGYVPEEVVGRQYWEFVHPEDREMVKEISLARARGEPAPTEYEFRHQSKKGDIVWVHNLPIIIKYQGQTANMGNLIQINARKQAEDQLKAEREILLSIFDSIDEVIYVADPETYELLYVNDAFKKNWGEGIGQKCYYVMQNNHSPCPFCTNKHIFGENLGKSNIREFQNTINGRWYRCIDRAIPWPDGRMVRYEIAIDIHDRKIAEEQRLKLETQLRQSQRMEAIGNLAGGIAHDFNNILSSIIGFTELALGEVKKDSMIEGDLLEVYTAGKRAKELVRQILAFARQSEEKVGPIQVDEILEEVLHFIRSTIPTIIEFDIHIESDSLIMGNQTQMHQIVMNLITNAAHAMEDKGGILEVTLRDTLLDKNLSKELELKKGNYIELTVSDTGVGIPPEIIDVIFDPYFTTKGPGQGTGMGLAMVHGIVKSYGGKISVDSTLGEGSTFTTYFPVIRKRKIQHLYEPEYLPTGKERILLVDDEAPIVKMGRRMLEELGYSVETRTSSVEALELFRKKPNEFDLVISDMTMPNLTGDILADELMTIQPDIPIILCTGYSKKITTEQALEMGIKAVAYKPMVMADLAKTIRKVLDEAMGERSK